MRITVPTLARDYDTVAVQALLSGKTITAAGWDPEGTFSVQTDLNVSAAESEAVKRWLTTSNDVENQLYAAGETALSTDRSFRDSTAAQLVSGAQAIIDTPTVSQANMRSLAQGVKALANQCEALSRQNIALIRLAQRLLDAAD